jgi:ribonuclease BN (tRNA processing enzyme)
MYKRKNSRAAFILLLLGLSGVTNAEQTRLTLLGTASGPFGNAERAGVASLVTVSGQHYLVDAGDSVVRQLARAGVSEIDVSTVFLTHLHDDHTAGLPALMSFAYTRRAKSLQIFGPPRTKALVDAAISFLATNAEIRMLEQHPHLADPSSVISGQSMGTGLVYSNDLITVHAVENTHFRLDKDSQAARNKSYAYRFETPDKVIVFTGDTGPSKAVAKLAIHADILVAEMVSEKAIREVPPDVLAHMLEEHLTPSEVGKLAAEAQVGTLVLSHIRHVSEKDVAEIRRHFDGEIVVGSDLDTL